MSYSIEALSDSCYPGSTCLINKLGIRNEEQLAFVESRIVLGKTEELWRNPIRGYFDFDHYKAIHRYLFEDIYAWAGEIRTVDMSKKGTRFIPASQINDMAKRIFDRLNRMNNLVGQAQDDFVVNITDFGSNLGITSTHAPWSATLATCFTPSVKETEEHKERFFNN